MWELTRPKSKQGKTTEVKERQHGRSRNEGHASTVGRRTTANKMEHKQKRLTEKLSRWMENPVDADTITGEQPSIKYVIGKLRETNSYAGRCEITCDLVARAETRTKCNISSETSMTYTHRRYAIDLRKKTKKWPINSIADGNYTRDLCILQLYVTCWRVPVETVNDRGIAPQTDEPTGHGI